MRIKIAVILAGFLGVGAAFAHSGATGVVKERMDNMKAIAGQMKVLGTMMKGATAFDSEVAKQSANALENHASHVTKLFKERNMDHPSEALPLVWDDWEGFSELANRMTQDSTELSTLIASGAELDALRPAFGKVAKSCQDCHQKYRVKK